MNKYKIFLSVVLVIGVAVIFQNCAPFTPPDLNTGEFSSVTNLDTFEAINSKILKPKCLDCHSSTLSSGGVDLSTYASTLETSVTSGDANSSSLYLSVASGSMPIAENLSSVEILAIKNWINSGAKDSIGSVANKNPIVSAGADKMLQLPQAKVTLMGSATDSDGTVVSMSWIQLSGPNTAMLSGANTPTLTVSGVIAGSYTFLFSATDDVGGAGSDTVTVTLTEQQLANVLPTANAGADQTLMLPTNSKTINGSGSDSDGTVASYSWTQVSGPNNATMSGSAKATLTVSGLIEGEYTFMLTVVDNMGAKATDNMILKVNPAPVVSVVKFSDINQTIFVPRCVSCHKTGNAKGGYVMDSYTKIMAKVTPNNANASRLYLSVQNNSMPTSGSLSTAEKNKIRDWINAGALNN